MTHLGIQCAWLSLIAGLAFCLIPLYPSQITAEQFMLDITDYQTAEVETILKEIKDEWMERIDNAPFRECPYNKCNDPFAGDDTNEAP